MERWEKEAPRSAPKGRGNTGCNLPPKDQTRSWLYAASTPCEQAFWGLGGDQEARSTPLQGGVLVNKPGSPFKPPVFVSRRSVPRPGR